MLPAGWRVRHDVHSYAQPSWWAYRATGDAWVSVTLFADGSVWVEAPESRIDAQELHAVLTYLLAPR